MRSLLAFLICLLAGPALADGCMTNAYSQKQDIVTISGTGAASQIVLTAPANGLRFSVTGFEIWGLGATSATNISATLSGLNSPGGSGTETFTVPITAGATTAITPFWMSASGCPWTGIANTAVVLTVPSFGAGNMQASAALHGFWAP